MFIRINAVQADALRGNYGPYHALEPIPLEGTTDYILTDAVLSHPAFSEALATLQALPAYPAWRNNAVYTVDEVVEHEGRLWRNVQAHTSQLDWSPPVVPALWVNTHEPGTIPAWVQPTGAHDAYALGAKVIHNGQVWESLIAANVWEPGSVGAGTLWRQVVA